MEDFKNRFIAIETITFVEDYQLERFSVESKVAY